MGPGDAIHICLVLCIVQYSRGAFNLCHGGSCIKGYVLEQNASVWSMLSLIKGVPKKVIRFGDFAEDATMLNSRVKCSIPTETKEFQDCNPFTNAEWYGVSDL